MVHTARPSVPLLALLAPLALLALLAPCLAAPSAGGVGRGGAGVGGGYLSRLLQDRLLQAREGRSRGAGEDGQRRPLVALDQADPQVNELDNIFQRIRKQAPPAVRCGGGGGRNPYECNDGLMGVWLRLMKNPDYSD